MTTDEPKDIFADLKQRLKYLRRLLDNAESQRLENVVQFIRSHIWAIEIITMGETWPSKDKAPFVFERKGRQYIIIGDVTYPVELDETLSPGEWYIKGKADDTRRT